MSVFKMYLHLGFDHIINIGAFDHILFIITLSAAYLLSDWKKVLILVTAFTIGHTLSLALSTLHIVTVDAALVEFLIVVTILLTSLGNILVNNDELSIRMLRFKYILTLTFGLIHGLGFSNYLKVLLGAESNIVKPLLAFNLGLEIGQLIIVLLVSFLATMAIKFFNIIKREWVLVLSGAGVGISILLIIERFAAM